MQPMRQALQHAIDREAMAKVLGFGYAQAHYYPYWTPGLLGYSEDLPFARWYRHARAARIADGPDEVHVGVVARDVLAGKVELL